MDLGVIDMEIEIDDSIEMPDPVASIAFDDLDQTTTSGVDMVSVVYRSKSRLSSNICIINSL
jgi:hypothetical protein